MSVLELSDTNHFERVNKESEWVLVDFWAPWCGPCQMMLPVLDRVAQSFAGKVTAAKANVDEHEALTGRFGIRGVPTLVLLHKGEVVDHFTGAQPEAAVEKWINLHIGNE